MPWVPLGREDIIGVQSKGAVRPGMRRVAVETNGSEWIYYTTTEICGELEQALRPHPLDELKGSGIRMGVSNVAGGQGRPRARGVTAPVIFSLRR